ncbi:hypothetical protein IFR05_012876 [Cadophora sp. M221]|nr:hypothetical protein IFR05_012876 [Cadophora sp. M221]
MVTPNPNPTGDTPASSSELIPRSAKRVKIAPSLSDVHHEMVTIIIKSDLPDKPDRKHPIYKNITCYHSPVLDKAFNGPFIEGQTQVMTIDDIRNPVTFGAIQSWIYTQKKDGWKEAWGDNYHVKLYQLWVLADRLIMPTLHNEMMTSLMETRRIPLHSLGWIYKNTLPESKLRSFLSDWCAKFKTWKNKNTLLAADVLAELLLDTLFAQLRAVLLTMENMKAANYFVAVD